jgi:PIN domain nuclease of toxin-antitoxin system
VILLDTHVWVWMNGPVHLLPPSVKEVLEEGEQVSISSISIWEAMLLLQKGRIRCSMPADQEVRRWLAANPVTISDLTAEIAILARALPFTNEDPADRFIAATARHLSIPLATMDQDLRSLSWLKIMP